MKLFTSTLAFIILTLSFSAQAIDITCACIEAETACKDVSFTITNQDPGTYLRAEFNDGLKTVEGFARVTRNINRVETVYSLGSHTLIKQGDLFSMLGSDRRCLRD